MKTRFSIAPFLTALLLALACSFSMAQVSFPSSNTVYTVEDGREFVQVWPVKNNEDSYIHFLDAYLYNNNNIGLVTDAVVKLSGYGNPIYNNTWPRDYNIIFSYSNNGTLMAYDHHSYNVQEQTVLTFDNEGRVARSVHLDLDRYSWDTFDGLAAKDDGGFYLYYRSTLNPGYYDDDNAIVDVLEFDITGKFLGYWDLRAFFRNQGRDPVEMQLAPNGNPFIVDERGYIYQFNKDFKVITRFKPHSAKGQFRLYPMLLRKDGNITLISSDAKVMQTFTTKGLPVKRVNIKHPDKTRFEYWNCALSHNGSLFFHDQTNDRVLLFSPEGTFVRDISKKVYTNLEKGNVFGRQFSHHGALHIDNKDILYTDIKKKIIRFDQTGRILNQFRLPHKGESSLSYAVTPEGNIIHYASFQYTDLYDSEGNYIKSLEHFNLGENHAYSPDGHVWQLDGRGVIHYSPDFKILERLYFSAKIKAPNGIDVDNNGLLHILDRQSQVKIFHPRKGFQHLVNLEEKAGSLAITPSGNYLAEGKLFRNTGELIGHCFIPESNNHVLNKKNQAFIGGMGITQLSLAHNLNNTSSKYSIKGRINFDKQWYSNYLKREKRLFAYLEGTTPGGKRFYSIVEPDRYTLDFEFYGIPNGSNYVIWANHPYSDFWTFGKQVYPGKIAGKNENLTLRDKAVSTTDIKVKGRVIDKYGFPLCGVRVRFKGNSARTDIYGNYCLIVPPLQSGRITAFKPGIKIENNSRDLNIGLSDQLYINFKESE